MTDLFLICFFFCLLVGHRRTQVLARVHGNNTAISMKTAPSSTIGDRSSIYDGTKVSINNHPYMVIIDMDKSKYCTGVIVSASWVLTTADCAQETHKNMDVLMHRRYDKVRRVKNVTLHPKYPSSVYDYDFACVQIRGRFHFSEGVMPVKIPRRNPVPGSTMVVAAWGDKTLSSKSPKKKHDHAELVEGTMTWLNDADCNRTLVQMGITWTDRTACAFHRNQTTLCTGAWGAPVVKGGVLYGQFVGAAADGFCSSRASPVILSDVSAVVDWIHDVTGAVVQEHVV